MPDKTVYKQTAKGQRELGARSSALPAALGKLLKLIDGKATVDEVKAKLGQVDDRKLQDALEHLKKNDYIEAPAAGSAAGPITLDFTMHARAPGAKPTPETKPAAPLKPQAEEKIDFSGDAPAPQPTAAQIAEAQDKTLAGMRTLKEAGYYVSILSKPGIKQPPRSETKYSVLIIDDDAANTLIFARALMMASFDVRSAESREKAMVELKKVPLPDAIVLNPQVHELNGLDLLAKLQVHKYYASVPVIVITAGHTHEAVVDALARGAAGYMTKPFKPEALLDNVRAVLGLN
jgi:two-component system, chemotaxis family, chemotaxis protein CheY